MVMGHENPRLACWRWDSSAGNETLMLAMRPFAKTLHVFLPCMRSLVLLYQYQPCAHGKKWTVLSLTETWPAIFQARPDHSNYIIQTITLQIVFKKFYIQALLFSKWNNFVLFSYDFKAISILVLGNCGQPEGITEVFMVYKSEFICHL